MNDRRQRLLERKKRLEQQLKELDEREARQKQKNDPKRAQVAGRAVLKHAKNDPQFAATLRDILDTLVTGKRNRKLFDLPGDRPPAEGEGQVVPLEDPNREPYS
jgi:transposase